MKITNEIEQKLFNISRKETVVYRFLQIISYGFMVSDESLGFTSVPDKDYVLNELEKLISTVSGLIKEGNHVSPNTMFNTNTGVGKLLLMREEMIRELLYELTSQFGTQGSDDTIKELMFKEMKDIKIYEGKSFLRNVYLNMASKNNIMKFMTGTLFLSSAIESPFFGDITYTDIMDALPKTLKLVYITEQVKEGDFALMLNLKKIDLDDEVDEEITESNIRDFIENMIESLRDVNTTFTKSSVETLISSGRNQSKL